jgi:uncharacterized membrane protein
MSASFVSLLFAALAWIVVHIGVAGTSLRGAIVRAIGEGPFRGLFVVASFALIYWLAHAYSVAGAMQVLWASPHWLNVILMLLMLPALLLFIGSVTVRNPTSVAGASALAADSPARGILRVTRHPMLWAFAIWAAIHLLILGTLGGGVFFGAFLITALVGMPSVDAKIAKRDPQRWASYAQATSIVPFVAISQGRNRFDIAEIGWWRPALAVALWFVLIGAHQWLFHVPTWAVFLGR